MGGKSRPGASADLPMFGRAGRQGSVYPTAVLCVPQALLFKLFVRIRGVYHASTTHRLPCPANRCREQGFRGGALAGQASSRARRVLARTRHPMSRAACRVALVPPRGRIVPSTRRPVRAWHAVPPRIADTTLVNRAAVFSIRPHLLAQGGPGGARGSSRIHNAPCHPLCALTGAVDGGCPEHGAPSGIMESGPIHEVQTHGCIWWLRRPA